MEGPSMEGVVFVSWPGPAPSLPSEGRGGPARLYLVEPGQGVPDIDGCLEDWVVLPASDEEIAARADALMRRVRRHRPDADDAPRLDPVGVLHCRDRWVDLPPLEARLMGVLLAQFGQSVPTEALLAGGWGGSRPGTGALRVHILRLRRRIAPLGLAIHTLPGRGYLLSWS